MQTTVLKVDESRWREAQEFERRFQFLDLRLAMDHGKWWIDILDIFKVLQSETAANVLEVGCGKYTNARLILTALKEPPQRLYFEDPLIKYYMVTRLRISRRSLLKYLFINRPSPLKRFIDEGAEYSSAPLEDLPWRDELMNMVICINVLDHVMDITKCVAEIDRVLSPGGILVLGQDLSNEEDYQRAPESWTDVGHPIKVEHKFFDEWLTGWEPLFFNILHREEGSNPNAHYGTYLFIGRKPRETQEIEIGQ